MKNGGRVHRVWWEWVEHGGPQWAWRPYCWLRRWHEDDSYGHCAICRSAASCRAWKDASRP